MRRTINEKNPENKLASGDYLSSANEDILLEILLRLPNSRCAIQCSTVCRGWLELISRPQFIPRFIRMRRRDHCYTILFRRDYYHLGESPEYYQVVCKLFSNESLLLNGTSSPSNYFDFMPELAIIRASCNDLLLMSPDPRGFRPRQPCPKLYICNPVTRKWSLVPGGFPHGSMTGFALICDQDVSKVVIIYLAKIPPRPHVPAADFFYRTRVMVFCTKSAQWSELNFYFPIRPARDYIFSYRVVTCNGTLYWIDGYKYLDRIVALDLFNNNNCSSGQRGVVIHFPEVIRNNKKVMVHLGAVGGDKLRLLHMFRDGGRDDRKCFAVKVWELINGGSSWVLVHEIKDLEVPNGDENNVVSVAFHPKDCDVVFVICGTSVFEYRFSENACYKIGEIREAIGVEGLDSFLLEHPGWPTAVPSF